MAQGISLHFGINDYSIRRLQGVGASDLKGCINDAYSMKAIADTFAYESYLFIDNKASYSLLSYSMIKASSKLREGDILLLTFSGHGYYERDLGAEEPDRQDSYLVLYDEDIYDDEIMILLKLFRPGVRVFCIFDACHSSTMIDTDIQPRSQPEIDRLITKLGEAFRSSVEKINQCRLNCSIKSISGAWDLRTASDGTPTTNSLFTEYLVKVWDGGNYKKNIFSYYKDVKSKLTTEQGTNKMPTYQKRGPGISKFNTMQPYRI